MNVVALIQPLGSVESQRSRPSRTHPRQSVIQPLARLGAGARVVRCRTGRRRDSLEEQHGVVHRRDHHDAAPCLCLGHLDVDVVPVGSSQTVCQQGVQPLLRSACCVDTEQVVRGLELRALGQVVAHQVELGGEDDRAVQIEIEQLLNVVVNQVGRLVLRRVGAGLEPGTDADFDQSGDALVEQRSRGGRHCSHLSVGVGL